METVKGTVESKGSFPILGKFDVVKRWKNEGGCALFF